MSSLIANAELIDDMKWKFLKEKLPESIYTKIIADSLEKHLAYRKNYYLVASKYQELLKDKRKGLETVMRMLVKSII